MSGKRANQDALPDFGMPTPRPWRATACAYVRGPDVVVATCGDWKDKELLRFNRDRWEADAALIVACVNALAGIADPAGQVARWKARDVLERRGGHFRVDELNHETIAAFAAEWTPE